MPFSALFEHYVQLVDLAAEQDARKFHLLRSLRALIEHWAAFIFRSGRATPQVCLLTNNDVCV